MCDFSERSDTVPWDRVTLTGTRSRPMSPGRFRRSGVMWGHHTRLKTEIGRVPPEFVMALGRGVGRENQNEKPDQYSHVNALGRMR